MKDVARDARGADSGIDGTINFFDDKLVAQSLVVQRLCGF